MTIGRRILLTLAAVLATASLSVAKGSKPDCDASLAAVQAAVASSQCDCAAATSHGQFVRCAGQVVKGMVAGDALDKRCKGAMVKVFAKSSCGKADAVTCCVTGRPCRVKKSEACTRLGGTPGSTAFCADACAASPSGAFVD
jgi:hypothetical protein